MLSRLTVIALTSSMLCTALEKRLLRNQLEQLRKIEDCVDDLSELIHGLANLTAADKETTLVA